MPGTPTTNLQLIVPTVGGDANTWGTELNTNLATIDQLGAVPVVNVNGTYVATIFPFPITVIRVTTGGLNISVTLPAPSAVPNKLFIVFITDLSAAGQATVAAADGSPINGQASWQVANQYAFQWFLSNGASYDIVG